MLEPTGQAFPYDGPGFADGWITLDVADWDGEARLR